MPDTSIECPVWLDCDPGHDDAFAIVLAAGHPDIRLLGISTVNGNASLERTTNNARSILTAIEKRDVPVFPGAAKPFCRDPVHAPDIHGSSGIDGTDLLPAPDRCPVSQGPAVIAMHEALKAQPPGRVWLVATGALTNVASLFALYPHLAERLGGLCIMGGAIGAGFTNAPMGTVEGEGERIGNITPYAEFNIYCDPEAAQSIFSNPVLTSKTTLIPLDLTHQVLATKAVLARLLEGKDASLKPHESDGATHLRRMLHDLLTFFAKTYANVFGIVAGPPLHDPVAVAVVLDICGLGNKFQDRNNERWHVSVVTDGLHMNEGHGSGRGTVSSQAAVNQVGRTIVEPAQPVADGKVEGVRIPRSVDLEWFWDQIFDAISCIEQSKARSD